MALTEHLKQTNSYIISLLQFIRNWNLINTLISFINDLQSFITIYKALNPLDNIKAFITDL